MESLKKQALTTSTIIRIVCVVIMICAILSTILFNPKGNVSSDPTKNPSAPDNVAPGDETSDLTGNVNQETSDISDSNTTAPTFTSQEATYNYAVTQLYSGNYCAAIKYFRQVGNYKNSETLQAEAYKRIHQLYFSFADNNTVISCEGMSEQEINANYVDDRSKKMSFAASIRQNTEDFSIDTDGNLYVTYDGSYEPAQKQYNALANYNKNVKFDMISYNYILTKDNKVVYQGSSTDKDPYIDEDDFVTINSDILEEGEKIIYICSYQALSNFGNVYDYNYGTNEYTMRKLSDLTNIVSIKQGYGSFMYLTADGTIISGNPEIFPDVKNWSDIVSISCGTYHCFGLRADGSVVVATQSGTDIRVPLNPNVSFTTITCDGLSLAAISTTGEVYICKNIDSGI